MLPPPTEPENPMTTPATTQYQPGDRVTWTSPHTHGTYTGTVNGRAVADQLVIEQDPRPGDTHRATWHVAASQLRPLDDAAPPNPARDAADALTRAMELLKEAATALPEIAFLVSAAHDSADSALMIATNEAKLAEDEALEEN